MTSDLNHKKTRNGINSLLQKESTAGILLLICTMISVALASFPETEWINNIWDKEGSIKIADFSLDMSLRHWVNDALMAIFFFSVGLEIKREMLFGQLTSLKKSSLPVMAAIGGMAVPALIYSIFNAGEADTAGGWGIPMATDIAFAIGIISLLGSRVPANLKIFLTALAIVDDLGAIIVLAVFYPSHALHLGWLIYAGIIMVILFIFNRARLQNRLLYIIPGILMWYFTYRSGIHATIAGVMLASLIPAKCSEEGKEDSLMHKFIHGLHPAVNFLIIPLFALANAGVAIDFGIFGSEGIPPVSLGIFFGLLIGKPLGIFLLSFIGVKTGAASLPEGVTWGQVAAMGLLGGIGFTMSIFINSLAFSDPVITDIGKMSILLTSAIAAVTGLFALDMTCRKK
ncbi:MAG: Na+/H+ antiporter NhaA [Bacteroidetes bacterium]|uniref:Na(+)/H(+) antiporter NhaA n=1 Tax=Candidatus Cryptobacteroides excrementavium TaxID=2840759 RepID=A0A9D9NRD6_9BACT|nr:Na+/H+ antiporter NhaA [Candidatus Cryptobacteroides excrementavium]